MAFSFSCLTFARKINVNELDRKIRVGAVSYLNTKPLLYGIEHSNIISEIDLTIDYPSRIASMLIRDEIDMGLVPVAILPKLKTHYLCTDYCIGSNGAVASVCLFSEVPMNKIEKILLDYQSRTSVQLAKILLKEYWKIDPETIDATADFRGQIKETTAALVIGDRALEQRNISPYVYDLGSAWKDFTGLPFVFAAWISNKKLDDEFVTKFNAANKYGVDNIETLLTTLHYEGFDLHQYYTKHISYFFDEEKRKGLNLFLKYLK
jgi:chorismate dehydratase